jgi:hypothetical protein
LERVVSSTSLQNHLPAAWPIAIFPNLQTF